MDKLFRVVESAFKAQILEDPLMKASHDMYNTEQASETPDKRLLTSNFEKMRAHFNVLTELEAANGGLSSTDSLRDVLKKNAFLLGLESCKNKNHQMELTFT